VVFSSFLSGAYLNRRGEGISLFFFACRSTAIRISLFFVPLLPHFANRTVEASSFFFLFLFVDAVV